jgi:MoaA/NifB/PqqE/SkfB family radical SAM enzyme
MVEPTLSCRLACPTCKRVQEANRRAGSWDLDPDLFAALLRSCARHNIVVEEIHYLGWGEPLLHTAFDRLTQIARELAPAAVQEVTTTGNI